MIKATNQAGYEAPAGVTSDAVVFAPLNNQLHVLLVRREEEPFKGYWALPGGFMNQEEDALQTAQRKLTEKTGVGNIYLEQLATYTSPNRDPRGWIPAIGYLALVSATVLKDENQAKWFDVNDLPQMAFDHASMISQGVERLRGKLWYSNIAVSLLPREFTLSAARKLYETISGVKYEQSNFRRELESSGLVRPTGNIKQGGSGRPAQLYEFAEQNITWTSRRSKIPAQLKKESAALSL